MPRILYLLIVSFILTQLVFVQQAYAASRGTIRAGAEVDYPPFSVVSPDGNADGFSVELLRASLAAVHVDVDFKTGPWERLKNELSDGTLRVLPLVGRTPEREGVYDFTFPYLTLHGAVFVHMNNSRIKNVSDLADKRVAVMKGDNAEEFVRRTNLSSRIVAVETYVQAMRMLSDGKVEAVVAQRFMGIELLNKIKIKNVIPLDLVLEDFQQDFCFAVREGDKELLSLLNEGLAVVIANGEFNRLHKKWFGPLLPKHLTLKDMGVYLGMIFIPVVGGMALLLITFLRVEVRRKTETLVQEIEQRKRAEVEQRKSEENYRNLFNSMVNGFALHEIILDKAGVPCDYRFLAVNPAFERLTNLKAVSIIGRCILDIDPETERVWIDTYGRVALTGEHVHFEQYSAGQGKTFEVIAYQPQPGQFACIFADITERKRAEELLHKSKEGAEAANEAKSEFLTNIAHDFRTPMHTIMGFSSFLQSENMTEKQKKFAGIINASSAHLLSLIESILDVSRLESGRIQLRLIEFDLKKCVRAAADVARVELMDKRVVVNVSIDDAIPSVKGDEVRFNQIVTNLVGNAVKYTDEGEISVGLGFGQGGCAAGQCRVRFAVKDTGFGISRDKQLRIFDTFTQFHEFEGGKTRGGVGLGLYITKTLVDLMGGEIRVLSEEGKGSEFIVTLDFDIADKDGVNSKGDQDG